MDNPHDNPGVPADGGSSQTGITPPRSLFADDSLLPPSADAQGKSAPSVAKSDLDLRKWVLRVGLPVLLLLAGIAGIVWLKQNLPSSGQRLAPVNKATVDSLRFEPADNTADPKDKGYIPEFELGNDGYSDFPFTNTSTDSVDFGVKETSCTCSGVLLCVLQTSQQREDYRKNKDTPDLSWIKVEIDRDLQKHLTIPGESSGVLRIRWTGNKTEPELIRLKTTVWWRAGPDQNRATKEFSVMANYVHAVRFERYRIELEKLGPKDVRTASFYCWSATRAVEVKPANVDKCLQAEVQPLTAKQCQDLQASLRGKDVMTRVLSAAKVKVTLFEEKDGQQLDMGLFFKRVPLEIVSQGQPLTKAPLPMVRASVLDVVTLSAEEKGSMIDMSSVKTKKVTLYSPVGVKLSFIDKDQVMPEIEAELKAVSTVDGKTQWEMLVTAKAGFLTGLAPENAVLVLHCELPAVGSAPPVARKVRIPVIGG